MRKDEKLKTIYETIAPHITRNESSWRDYLRFASTLYKYSFDNTLLIFAQNPNVTMLAPTAIWNRVGRYVNKGSTGIAVCEYENARLTMKHLFDFSQTHGKEFTATNWKFDDELKKHIVIHFSKGYSLNTENFSECIQQISHKAVMESQYLQLQSFQDGNENSVFESLPQDGLQMQLQELINDSISYFVGKRCGLSDEEINIGDGMATIAHFNTLPLIARLGHLVTSVSKGILMEIERSIKTFDRERNNRDEHIKDGLYREGWNETSQYSNIQRKQLRPASGQIRQDGNGISKGTKSTAIYDFENGWNTDGDNAQSSGGSSGENREHTATDADGESNTKDRGYNGEDKTYEQPKGDSGGNSFERTDIQSEINQLNNENYKPSHDESLDSGSFLMQENIKKSEQSLFSKREKSHEEQLMEIVLQEGSIIEGGKMRIYDYSLTNPTGSAFAAFLKNEYGIGGHSVNKGGIRFEDHDSKGISFDWVDENGEKHNTTITWLKAAIIIQNLINEERYITTNEIRNLQNEELVVLKTDSVDVNDSLQGIESDVKTLFFDKPLEEQGNHDNLKNDNNSLEAEENQEEILSTDEKYNEDSPNKINFQYSESYNLYPNGAKTKYKNNIEAIKLLKRIESENRLADHDEQIVLARYVGWGGLANAFSDTVTGWENEYQELKHLFDEKEYEDARNSTITAYYTEPDLIKHMYNAIRQFGFAGGKNRKILDPAMGTGNFFSVLPDSLKETAIYGVEIDSITGRIAKQLYQKSEISVQSYETTNYEDNSFDIILGNIPFNNIKLYDKRYADEDFLIHDYFIAKSLDLLKPGGIIGFITSKGTMDKKDTKVREYIAERADLIGAIRLPNNAFKALAGTEVTADILFFQKYSIPRNLDKFSLPNWVFTDTRKADYIHMNQYFIDNPDMILGKMQHSRNMYGNEDGTACIAPDGQDLNAELNDAIIKLNATFCAEADISAEEVDESDNETIDIEAPTGTKNYTYAVMEDKIYYCEHNKLIPQDYIGKKADRIKGLCEIREALLEVIEVQTREYVPSELKEAQNKLNDTYDDFVSECGFINDKANIAVFSDDDQFPLLRSIEDQSHDKKTWTKAPIFYKATIKSYRLPQHAETAKEALEISLNVKMRIDLSYMEALTNKSADTLIEELGDRIYLNPQKYYGNYYEGWELNEEYLSGQVKDKLLYAKMKAEEYPELFSRNVKALEAVQPQKLLPGEIDFRIGTPWIPIEYYRQFMHEAFGTPYYLKDAIDIDYMEFTTQWRVLNKTRDSSSVKVNNTYGTKRVNAYQIFEDCLNLQSTTVRDPVPYVDANGKDQIKYVINANETMIARAKQNQIKEAFAGWLFNEKDRAEILLKIYNDKFNTIRPRVYDGSHLFFPGMSDEIKLRPHQMNFAARVIYSGTGLAGHVVGAGKTAALIASGMYLKSIGAIKKPMYVVPNHLTEQWAKEFYRFFPQAKILVTTKKDFEKANRNKFVSRIAMGEYDAIIIGHSQFERIPVSKERQERQLNDEINQISYVIKKIRDEKGDNWSIKQMVIFQNNLKNRLTKLLAEGKKDDLLTFEQLGADYMFVDEAHVYKNCFTYTKMKNVAGIGKSSSQRASDMLLKCQYLQEINNGKGVVFATGTPISNSMSEMYVMQKFLQPQLLQKMALNYFDSWAATFGEVVSSLEITPEGSGYRMRNRFAKFHNLPELMNMFGLVADIQTADMLKLPTPDIDGGKATIIATEATQFQKMLMETFVERAEKIRTREVEACVDNMLKLTNEAKLMSIDPRLVNGEAPNDEESKLNIAIRKVFEVWEDTKESRSTQIIFCDSGTPKPGQFNVYDEIKDCLIEKGISAEEIAFVHDAKTDEQRETLFEKVRAGEIRILLGSTSKLGTGTNVQNKLIAVHHLDCPWRPSDIEQRDGRILRQGNENPVVNIFRYVTKGTFDAYLWQIQEQKLKYISQVMTGKSISRSCEDMDETVLSAAEVKAIATSNPLLAEKMEVDNEVTRLKLLKANWNNERILLKRNVESKYPNLIAHCEQKIEALKKDIGLKDKTASYDFIMFIDGKSFDERVKAGERLLVLSKINDIAVNSDPLEVGSYRGFKILLARTGFEQIDVQIKGALAYRVELGNSELGCITRIENAVERIDGVLNDTVRKLEDAKVQLKEAKVEVDKPFEFEERLNEFSARQAEINTKLEFKELREQEEVIADENGQGNENEYQEEEVKCEMAIAER